jgi:hypothetical protein
MVNGTQRTLIDAPRRRLLRLQSHLCAASPTAPAHTVGLTSPTTAPAAAALASQFAAEPEEAWEAFVRLQRWEAREAVFLALSAATDATPTPPAAAAAAAAYLCCYRRHMADFLRDDFYDLCPRVYKARYDAEGEINVPLLKQSCLPSLAAFGESNESLGKHRYGSARPTYPPGEVLTYAEDDPRAGLTTDVNMTAIPSRHLPPDSPIQWVYHSPHLRAFLSGVMGCATLYPYLSDLGLAINVMRPAADDAQAALGFHFDSIDSSNNGEEDDGRGTRDDTTGDGGGGTDGTGDTSPQPKGATGVIGITDCLEGGERVVFPTIHREDVADVARVLDAFDPLQPGATIGGTLTPSVCREPTSGVLYLFNGGDVLHGVSSVRSGSRIAAVFLFKEAPPSETVDSKASAAFFYDE